MKALISSNYTDIFLLIEEVKEFCKPGKGADTCIWLQVGENGFECSYYHKHPILLSRWMKGETNAKRDGCDKVKRFEPLELGVVLPFEVIF